MTMETAMWRLCFSKLVGRNNSVFLWEIWVFQFREKYFIALRDLFKLYQIISYLCYTLGWTEFVNKYFVITVSIDCWWTWHCISFFEYILLLDFIESQKSHFTWYINRHILNNLKNYESLTMVHNCTIEKMTGSYYLRKKFRNLKWKHFIHITLAIQLWW